MALKEVTTKVEQTVLKHVCDKCGADVTTNTDRGEFCDDCLGNQGKSEK